MSYADIRYEDIDGTHIAYHREGTGDAVLFIHGITTYSFLWQDIATRFVGSMDVIVPDLPGCGDSDKSVEVSFSLSSHADRLAALIRKLDVGPVHLVCHDVGGGIGQIMAVRSPELVRDLIVMNTVAFDFWPVQPIIAMRTPIIRQLAMSALDLGMFRLVVRNGMYHKERLTDGLIREFHRPMGTVAGRKAFLHFARCLDNQDLTSISDELAALDMPVLIIRGEQDAYLSEAITTRLAAHIPDAEVIRLQECGHFLQFDAPDELAAILGRRFGQDPE